MAIGATETGRGEACRRIDRKNQSGARQPRKTTGTFTVRIWRRSGGDTSRVWSHEGIGYTVGLWDLVKYTVPVVARLAHSGLYSICIAGSRHTQENREGDGEVIDAIFSLETIYVLTGFVLLVFSFLHFAIGQILIALPVRCSG
jgi:hypothetical protein